MKSTRYIAFLRAINVGGRFVKMEVLRSLFSELGFENVRTYIQSGNVFFESNELDRDVLALKIEAHLKQALSFEVTTILRTISELEATVKFNPFKDLERTEDTRFCILFMAGSLPPMEFPIFSPKKDCEIIAATSSELFVVLHQTPGRPSNPILFVEKHFKRLATARFAHTTEKILEAAQS